LDFEKMYTFTPLKFAMMKKYVLSGTKSPFLISLFLLLLSFGASGQNITIIPNKATTGSTASGYETSETSFTASSIGWKIRNWNPNTLQVRGNQNTNSDNFYFLNTSVISGNITKIILNSNVNVNGSDSNRLNSSNITLLTGTSEQTDTTGGTTGTAGTKKIEWTPTAGTTFFRIQFAKGATSGTATISSIVIEYTSCAAPTAQSTDIAVNNIGTGTADLSWTRPTSNGGDHCAVFVKQDNTGSAVPVNGTAYTASTTFGSGSQIGTSGWYCVYNGTGNSVSVSGLSGNTDYRVMVVEYNDCSSSPKYFTDTATDNPKNFTTSTPTSIGWGNLETGTATMTEGGAAQEFTGRIWINGITGNNSGNNATPNLIAEIGYNTTDTNPNTWTNWSAMSWKENAGTGNNDDRYTANVGTGFAPGTYYVAIRYKYDNGDWYYAGYNAGGGGEWDGTTYKNGTLTVNPDVVDYANIQSPDQELTKMYGEGIDVFSRVYEPGITPGASNGDGNFEVMLGYSKKNPTTISDFEVTTGPDAWTWLPMPANPGYTSSSPGYEPNNDEYWLQNFGATLSAGTYYYVARYKKQNSSSYIYGGNKFLGNPNEGGIWDGTTYNAGKLTILASNPDDYFRSKQSGDWTNISTWQSSPTGADGSWINATVYPDEDASSVIVRAEDTVNINSSNIYITNTDVYGTLQIATDGSYSIVGDEDIELTIENGGVFLVDRNTFAVPGGDKYGLIKTGGKIIAGSSIGSGSDFVNAYIGYYYGLFYFGDQAVCEWQSTRTLGSSTPKDSEYFYPYQPGDVPIFRVVSSPEFEFGSGTNPTIFHSVLELESNATFTVGRNASKTFEYGVKGTGTLLQSSGSGNIILGNGNNIPDLEGDITINISTNRLKFPNGVNINSSANITVQSNDGKNSLIERQGGIININGTLDITNMRITNSSPGGISINNNGKLRTSNTGGLYGTGSAIPSGTLTINDNSTIEYYAVDNQKITTGLDYYHIIFSGAGTKTPSNAVNVDANGSVTITGTPIVDFSTNNLASTGNNNTAFNMDGGRLILGTTGTQPNMRGDYNLTGGTVEFVNSSSTPQTIRNGDEHIYQNIEINGTNVGNSSGNILLHNDGTFSVKTNGIFAINDNSIKAENDLSNNVAVSVENNGTFKTGNSKGFSGFSSTFSDNSAIHSNITNINLMNGSTVEYSREGDQLISAQTNVGQGLEGNYYNLKISGSGEKFPDANLTVNNVTNVESGATLSIPETNDDEMPNVFTSKKGVQVAETGNLILENNANLLQDATGVTNIGNIEAQREATLTFVSVATRADYNYWASPVSGQKLLYNALTSGTSFSPGTPNNRIYQYKESNDKFTATQDTHFVNGKGYAIRAESGENGGDTANGTPKTFKFVGVPNNGDIETPPLAWTNEDHGYNLIGNPYPSNLDLDEFWTVNENFVHSTAYFWTNNQYTKNQEGSNYSGNNYATINRTGGTPATYEYDTDGPSPTPTTFVKPGQGFIIQSKQPGKLAFNNDMRKAEISPFFNNKSGNDKDRFWLTLTSPSEVVNTILVGYINGATNDFEKDFDAPLLVEGSDAFYSLLSSQKLAIQGRQNPFIEEDVVPLGTKHYQNGTYTIALKNPEGIFANEQKIYLHDKLNDSYTNLSESSYQFDAEAGSTENRFEIVYQPSDATLATDLSSKENLWVYRNGENFVVKSTVNINEIEVYDVSGRLQQKIKGNTKEIVISGSALVSGMYVLKIKRGNDLSSEKIIK